MNNKQINIEKTLAEQIFEAEKEGFRYKIIIRKYIKYAGSNNYSVNLDKLFILINKNVDALLKATILIVNKIGKLDYQFERHEFNTANIADYRIENYDIRAMALIVAELANEQLNTIPALKYKFRADEHMIHLETNY